MGFVQLVVRLTRSPPILAASWTWQHRRMILQGPQMTDSKLYVSNLEGSTIDV